METGQLIREVRDIARIGIVNAHHDRAILNEAADRLEELEERVAIMMEGNWIRQEQLDMMMEHREK